MICIVVFDRRVKSKMNPQTNVDVPPSSQIYHPTSNHPVSFYDYLALVPALIVSLTPLILGLRAKKSKPDK